MTHRKTRYLIAILWIYILFSTVFHRESFAQSGPDGGNFILKTISAGPPKYLLTIGLFNEAAIPPLFNSFKPPLHPGVSAGVERFLAQRKKHYWSWASNIAFYHHRMLENGLFINTEIGLNYPLGRTRAFYAQSFLGVGYLRTYVPGKVYKFENGGYVEQNDKGTGHFIPSLSLRGGYKPWNKSGNASGLFVQYQVFVDTSFSSPNAIPILPHGLLYAGISVPISSK
jgi:hypothetical protein